MEVSIEFLSLVIIFSSNILFSLIVNDYLFLVFFIYFKFLIFFFFLFWLHWVFVAARGLSLVAASRGYSSLQCAGFSLRWLLLL